MKTPVFNSESDNRAGMIHYPACSQARHQYDICMVVQPDRPREVVVDQTDHGIRKLEAFSKHPV